MVTPSRKQLRTKKALMPAPRTMAKKQLSTKTKLADKKAIRKVAIKAVKTVMNNAAKQRQFYVKDDEDINAPCRVDEILDSKPGLSGTLFLVRFAGDKSNSTSWIKESELGSRDILWQYSSTLAQNTPTAETQAAPRSRASKTRAKLLLRHDIQFEANLRDAPTKSVSGKGKRTKRSLDDDGEPIVKGAVKASKRKTNKSILDETRRQERAQRIDHFQSAIARFQLPENTIHEMCLDCCGVCSAREYHRAIKMGDTALLSKLADDTKLVPNWTIDESPDTPFQLPTLTAMLSGKTELIEILLKANTTPRGPPLKDEPNYNTGFVSKLAFGSFAKTVYESRGNRKGNQAFYERPRHPILDIQYSKNSHLYSSHCKAILAAVRHPSLSSQMIDYLWIKDGNARNAFSYWAFYEAVAAGNRSVAASIAAVLGETWGLNKVHLDVLKLDGNKAAQPYRRNQILKKATENFQITPVECAAIHPKRKYLEELFEQLDDLGQGHTDGLARTVAHFAAASETSDCLEYLLSKGFNCMQLDKNKISPLLIAAKCGREHNIKLLLNTLRGSSPEESLNVADTTMLPQRWTALHHASYHGHAGACRVLIQEGAKAEAPDARSKATPLHFAATQGHTDCIKVLIEEGKCDIDIADKFGVTPLHSACKNGQYGAVVVLLSFGADVNGGDTSENTPLHYAAAYGWLDIVQLLVETTQCNMSPTNLWKSTPCGIADSKGHSKVVRYLLDNKTKRIDVNFKDDEGKTLLHNCVIEHFSSEYEANQIIAKAKHLMATGADPNLKDINGSTPLHLLARSNAFKMDRPLNHQDEIEHPYHYWVNQWTTCTANNSPKLEYDDSDGAKIQKELLNILVKGGANLEATELSGETPLAVAMTSGNDHVVEGLLENGASPLSSTLAGDNIFHYLLSASKALDISTPYETVKESQQRKISRYNDIWKLLTKKTSSLKKSLCDLANKPNDAGYSPILSGIHAAISQQLDDVKKYRKAIRNTCNFWNRPMSADQRTYYDFRYHFDQWISFASTFVKNFKPNLDAVRELEKGFLEKNPKAKPTEYPPNTGRCALHFACSIHHPSLVEFFVKHGANVNLPSGPVDLHKTPIMFSARQMPENYDHLESNTKEMIEKVNTMFDLKYPDYSDEWVKSNRILLDIGIQPYQIDDKMESAAMVIARQDNPSVFLDMLRSSAKKQMTIGINNVDSNLNSVLMLAVEIFSKRYEDDKVNQKDYEEAISGMLQLGSDVNMRNRQQHSALMIAVKENGIKPIVHAILTKSAGDIKYSACNKDDENALIIACKRKDPELIMVMLQAMPFNNPEVTSAVNQIDKSMNCPLSLAAELGNAEIIKKLLQLGADPNHNHIKSIPLIVAVKTKCFEGLQHLIRAGANVDAVDRLGNSVLHYAVTSEKVPIVKLILDSGAKVNVTNWWNQTPFHWAVSTSKDQINTSLRVEKLLLDFGADINATDNFGRTPLHTTFVDLFFVPDMTFVRPIKNRVQKTLKWREEEEKKKEIINHFVTKYGSRNTKYWFLDGKQRQIASTAAMEKKENKEDTTVEFASDKELDQYKNVKWEDLNESQETKSDRIDILDFLLQHPNLECDKDDIFGRSPLHYAARVGAFTCTTRLLEQGHDLNRLDKDMNTPINLSLMYNHIDYSVMMSQKGAILRSKIQLPDGKSMSMFEYSLSKSFINLGYFIMEKDISPIEYVHDALKTGKFHISSLLLNSAEPDTLKSSNFLNQSFFHIICSFSPFDQVVYDEYAEDFFNLFMKANVDPTTLDTHNRSPIHYASKFNQLLLLKKLLRLEKINLNVVDSEGKTEIWHAVNSNSIEAVKLLLENGANINLGSGNNPPVIYLATEHGNLDMVKILIQNGASFDDKECSDRPNAVMQAVITKNEAVLKILLDAGHSPNSSSMYVHKTDKKEKRYILHPIVAVCVQKDDKIFKLLLQYNTNVDVTSPEEWLLKGRTPLMYNLHIKNYERSKMLFDHKANVNIVDPNTQRSVFYTYMLETIDDHMLDFMWKLEPDVNVVDKKTGQTLLEFSIRKSNMKLLKLLLDRNADRNVASCLKSDKTAQNYNDQVPALYHAVLHNNYEAAEILLNHTGGPKINWKYKDRSGRNVITRAVRCFGTFSYENESMIQLLFKHIGKEWKRICSERDYHGERAIDYAAQQTSKTLYNELLRLGSDKARDMEDESAEMDTEYEYHLMPVERDADEARKILLEKAEAERISKGEMEVDEKAQVDPLSELQDVGEVVIHNGEPLDIILRKTDVLASQWGCNMFYKMSLIHNRVLELDILWTRWGALGEDGMHQKTPIPTREAAIAEFEKIFKSKTGNVWETRNTEFQSKPGKFNMVKNSPYKKDTILTELDKSKATVSSQLSTGIQDCLQLCLDFKHLKSAQNDSKMDLPLGQLSQEILVQANDILKEVDRILVELDVESVALAGVHNVARMKELNHKLGILSNEYYLLAPNTSHSKRGIVPLRNRSLLNAELSRLNTLRYFNYTANVLLAAQHRSDQIHPLDYVYKSLNCHMQELTPENGHQVTYDMVAKYMQDTGAGPSGEKYDLLHVFELERQNEAARYQPFATNENRMLLWHGSKISNFIGILKQGLRIKPAQAYETGSMFGSGLYFADMFLKSSGYCNDYTSVDAQPYSLLLLCEVALGKTFDLWESKFMEQSEENYLSTKGLGKYGPDPAFQKYDKNGLIVPQGPYKEHLNPVEQTNGTPFGVRYLQNNEYIVYDPAQVRMRYLLVVQNMEYCPVCGQQKQDESLKRLQDFNFDSKTYKHSMKRCNEFESTLINIQMVHQSTNTQDIYQEGIENQLAVLETDQCGADKLSTPMRLRKTTYVCSTCAHDIKDRLLINWFKMTSNGIPDELRRREDCKWGYECRTQHKNLDHAKRYNHLCVKIVE